MADASDCFDAAADTRQLLEGSAGLAIAALLRHAAQNPARLRDRNIVIVICGSRIGTRALQQILGTDQ